MCLHSRAAFTIIELLTVMGIILLLAGLVLGVAGHAQGKASQARAQAEIQALSAAIESYKIDNGTYPESSDTDALNPNVAGSPSYLDPTDTHYTKASEYLYQELSGYHTTTNPPSVPPTKGYFNFTPSQVAPDGTNATTVTPGSPYLYINDPWGFCYGYSTTNLAAQTAGTSTTSAGYNPTFDLWSTAGYSASGGKSLPTGITSSTVSTLWVKNW